MDDVEEQIRAAQDVVDRVEVRSPVRGIVVKKNFHTPGGVVSPGAVILELLPIGDERIIEAHVNPKDISYVSVGQEALVRYVGAQPAHHAHGRGQRHLRVSGRLVGASADEVRRTFRQ